MTATILTQELLKELIHYNPETGIFTCKSRDRRWFKTEKAFKIWNTRFAGKIPGGIDDWGYHRFQLLDIRYKAHRLAFLYMTGQFPINEMDHINGIRNDNRWINLRPVTRQENMRNLATHKDNISGHMGVSWHKPTKKWVARIQFNGEEIYLGLFDELETAAACRLAAEEKYGYHANHGRAAQQTRREV